MSDGLNDSIYPIKYRRPPRNARNEKKGAECVCGLDDVLCFVFIYQKKKKISEKQHI